MSQGRPLQPNEKVGFVKHMKSLLKGDTKPEDIVITQQELDFHERTK